MNKTEDKAGFEAGEIYGFSAARSLIASISSANKIENQTAKLRLVAMESCFLTSALRGASKAVSLCVCGDVSFRYRTGSEGSRTL